MEELIAFLEDKKEKVLLGGGKAAIDKQHQNGKLTARERIFLLLDENSFEETDLFIEHSSTRFGMDEKKPPADGVVTGYGTIDGRPVFI